MTRGLAVIILGLLVGAAVGVSIHHGNGPVSAQRSASTTVPVPVTAPGGGVSLGNGTKVLSEPVDLLKIAVPEGWQSVDVDPSKVGPILQGLIPQAPALASVLNAEARAASEGGVRLFAYSPAPRFAFLSVVSFASPGATPADESTVAAFNAQVKQFKAAVISVHTVHLPAGHAVQIDSRVAVGKQFILAQNDTMVTPTRTVLVQVVAQTASAAPPAYFADMLASLRFG